MRMDDYVLLVSIQQRCLTITLRCQLDCLGEGHFEVFVDDHQVYGGIRQDGVLYDEVIGVVLIEGVELTLDGQRSVHYLLGYHSLPVY